MHAILSAGANPSAKSFSVGFFWRGGASSPLLLSGRCAPRHTAHAMRGNDADAGGARESKAKAPADAMGTCFSADSGGGGAARAASSGKKGGAAAGGGGPSVKDDYVQGSKLGEGAFGVTYAAKSRATGEDVAIKKVDKRKLRNAHDVEQVRARQAMPVSLPPFSQPLSSRPPHALACARA